MPTKDPKVKANAQWLNLKAATQAQALLSVQKALEYSTPKELAKVFGETEIRMGKWSARELEEPGPCGKLQRRLQRLSRSAAWQSKAASSQQRLKRGLWPPQGSSASSAAQPPKTPAPCSSSSSSWKIDEGTWTTTPPSPPSGSPPPLSPLNKNDLDECDE